MEPTVPTSRQLRKAYTYILNQEKYLRVFLEDGEVPIDTNASERAIRGFCIGKKNWQMIDTINGAILQQSFIVLLKLQRQIS